MISHDRALDLAALRIDFGITEAEQAALAAHLAGCADCRLEVAEMERDDARLRRLGPVPPPAWVAHAIGRKPRPITALLLAATLVIGGSIGAAAFVGSTLDDATASLAPTAPADVTPVPASPLPRLAGWSAGRDMSTPRVFHTATRLLDGTVLVAGGGQSGARLATAELYDPTTDSFGTVASMRTPHSAATATLLPDGRVLVVGGGDKAAEAFDPGLNTWSDAGRMVITRSDHTATLLADGRVLVAGGTSGAATRTAEVFDPATATWHLVGEMATARASHTATLLADGRVLIVGGERVTGSGAVADTVEIFDPATETFTLATQMNAPRSRQAAMILVDGRVLVVSGVSGQDVLRSVEIFDPVAGTWTQAPEVNEPREAFTLTQLPGDWVLMVGGYSQGTHTVELRDPATGLWSLVGVTTSIRGFHTATALLDGRVLVAGGIDDTQSPLASTELWQQ